MTGTWVAIGVMLVFGAIFFRIAELDGHSGLLWATISITAGALTFGLLGRGFIGFAVSQIGVLAMLFGANWFRREDQW